MIIVLLLGALYGVLIAAMLFGTPKNKIAQCAKHDGTNHCFLNWVLARRQVLIGRLN
jgi:ABC-type enterobactin transport system permease subunit